MTRHVVALPTGQRIAVDAPAVFTVDPPRPVAEVRYALAMSIAKQIEPHIQRRADVKHAIRDQNGRLTGLAEFSSPDPSRRALAWQAAVGLVDQLMPPDAVETKR